VPGHDVFISYCQRDALVADRVARQLREAGFTVFVDTDLRGGDEIMSTIDTTIGEATTVVLLWSAAAAESPYVRGEIMVARDRKNLIPVLVDETPISTFFRSLRFRRLIVNGLWDQFAFQDLRRDVAERCGCHRTISASRYRQPRAPGGMDTPAHRTESKEFGAAPRLRDVFRGPAVDAIVEALATVDKLVSARGMSADLRSRIGRAIGADEREIVCGADLSASALDRAYVAVLAASVRYASGSRVSVVSFQELRDAEIRLKKEGYGLRATIEVGSVRITTRGSGAADLLLDVLYTIREELQWSARNSSQAPSSHRRSS
jgi:hypothetical protein